jgi:hypothetical protein
VLRVQAQEGDAGALHNLLDVPRHRAPRMPFAGLRRLGLSVREGLDAA